VIPLPKDGDVSTRVWLGIRVTAQDTVERALDALRVAGFDVEPSSHSDGPFVNAPSCSTVVVRDARIARVLDELADAKAFSLGDVSLAERVGLSLSRLRQLFKEDTGMSLSQYRRERALDAASQLLASSDRRVSEIAYALGFDDPAYFTRLFTKRFHLCPRQYRLQFAQIQRWIVSEHPEQSDDEAHDQD
jgi:AraC-like DNA-binding protein